MRETVGGADHEGIEGELRVQVRGTGVGGGGDQRWGSRLFPLLLVRGRCGGRGSGCGRGRLLPSCHELQGRIDRDRDAHGTAQIHRQSGRQLGLCLLLDPLLGEAVGDGQEDRAFNIPEGPRGAQHRRRDGAQLVCGDRVEGRSPRACEGIRLHDNLRTENTVSSVTTLE